MSGCLVGLIINLLAIVFTVIMRVCGFLLMLMVTAVSSVFIGLDTATERISTMWIQEAAGNGILLGYNPTVRDGVKAAAVGLLFLGWILNVLAVIWLLSLLF